MSKVSREHLKRLVAEHRLDDLIEELFQLLTNYLSLKKDSSASRIYDSLILISGKLRSIKHENILGIIDSKDSTLESNKIGYSLISVINEIPEIVFENQLDAKGKHDTIREKINKINSNTSFKYDIFLSFSSKDVSEAKVIAEELRGYGMRIFISDEVLKSNVGTSFFDKIDFALNNSKDFVLLATPNSMESEWVKTEYETFYNECFIPNKTSRKFIVFKGANFEEATIPTLLKRLQFADSISEILNSYIESVESERNAKEEKRQSEQLELERKAIEEKRQREQAELERKAIEEKRQREQAELERKAIEEKRQREQAELERRDKSVQHPMPQVLEQHDSKVQIDFGNQREDELWQKILTEKQKGDKWDFVISMNSYEHEFPNGKYSSKLKDMRQQLLEKDKKLERTINTIGVIAVVAFAIWGFFNDFFTVRHYTLMAIALVLGVISTIFKLLTK